MSKFIMILISTMLFVSCQGTRSLSKKLNDGVWLLKSCRIESKLVESKYISSNFASFDEDYVSLPTIYYFSNAYNYRYELFKVEDNFVITLKGNEVNSGEYNLNYCKKDGVEYLDMIGDSIEYKFYRPDFRLKKR